MTNSTDKFVFYHIPKTGGIWVKEAIRHAGIKHGRCRDRKGVGHPFGLKREHATPAVAQEGCSAGRFSFCFVRHPVSWLKSHWCYRVQTGILDEKTPIDRLWEDDFEWFVRRVLTHYPGGYVTQLYQYYVGPNADRMDFIGRQENLADDLVTALTLAGETFDEQALRGYGRRNIAAARPEMRALCELSEDVERAVIDTERWVMDTFYG
jgi:hypothetical protein